MVLCFCFCSVGISFSISGCIQCIFDIFLALTEHASKEGKVTGREKSEGLLSKIPPANKHYSGHDEVQILLLSRISVGSLSLCNGDFDLLIFFQWWTITAQPGEVHLSTVVTVLSPACLETNTKNECIFRIGCCTESTWHMVSERRMT